MLSLLLLLKSFQGASFFGRKLLKIEKTLKSVDSYLEISHLYEEAREHRLGLSKYHPYTEKADPFLLIVIEPEDVHPGQEVYCGAYVLRWSEVIELRRALDVSFSNGTALEEGRPIVSIGFSVTSVLRAGVERRTDLKLMRKLSEVQSLSEAKPRFQEAA